METKASTASKIENWEYKDRNYYLRNNKSPLTYTIPTRHSARYPLTWFDPDVGYERELRYATNQRSIFVDEQKGPCTMKHVVFESGILTVPKEKRNLQEFLHFHPHMNLIFTEFDKVVANEDHFDTMELELVAQNMAYQMDVEKLEAILRVELGTKVKDLTTKELKRDALIFSRRNPSLFIELAEDDNVELRNIAIKAVEARILTLADDNRTFKWASNGRKLMNVPFDENAYSAIAAWFKTDEGLEVYKSIQKKLK
jgi:hypothetical protein